MNITQQFVVALLSTAFLVFLLSLFVFLRSPRRIVNRSFAFYSMCIVIWSLGQAFHNGASAKPEALLWARFFHSGVVFISTGFVHFTLALLDREKEKKRVITALYIASTCFMLLIFTDLFIADVTPMDFVNFYWVPGLIYPVFLIFWLGSVNYALMELWKGCRLSEGLRQKQLRYLFWSSLIGYAGGITNYLPAFNIFIYPITPYATYTVPAYSLVVAYTITRYRFMDIHVVVKRTMAYSLSVGLLTGLFVVIVLVITRFFSAVAQIDSFQISIVAALLIAILFNPLRDRIQALVDRIFYKKSYDYYATVRNVTKKLSSMFDVQSIYSYVGNVISETLGLKNISLLAAAPGGAYQVVYGERNKGKDRKGEIESKEKRKEIASSSALVRCCRDSRDIVVRDELDLSNNHADRVLTKCLKEDIESFQGAAVVPVFLGQKLSLLIVLGEKISGDIFTVEDITLLRTIADQTAVAVRNSRLYRDKMNTEKLASIGMMSATFAHEIRNPLTSLKTFAQLMPEKYEDIEFRDTFSKIVIGEIEKIDGLIGDLLDFSSNRKTARINEFDLIKVVDEIVEYVKGRNDVDGGHVDFMKAYGGMTVPMSGDDIKLRQAFINIISNGYQAMHGRGTLTVHVKLNGERVSVSVEDTGEGIQPGELETIFDPFITSKEMGIGLGLAISKRIIEDHNGKISVQSQVGEGTTFTITLPVQKS